MTQIPVHSIHNFVEELRNSFSAQGPYQEFLTFIRPEECYAGYLTYCSAKNIETPLTDEEFREASREYFVERVASFSLDGEINRCLYLRVDLAGVFANG